MLLLNRNVDRTLTSEEAKLMLAEDAWEFDSHIKHLTKRWDKLLDVNLWKSPIPDDRIVVTASKVGGSIQLKPKNRACTVYKNLNFPCWLAKKPKKSGLCIEDFEDLVCKIEYNCTIKVLLEAGFILSIVVYKTDVVL